jgi:hypothetical protein
MYKGWPNPWITAAFIVLGIIEFYSIDEIKDNMMLPKVAIHVPRSITQIPK